MIADLRRAGCRYLSLLLLDALVVAASLLLAWSGRAMTASLNSRTMVVFGLAAIAVFWGVNGLFGLYHRLWRYASAGEVVTIASAAAASTVILMAVDLLWPGRRPVPLSVALFMGFFAFVGLVGVRYRGRVWTGLRWRWRAVWRPAPPGGTRVLIVGAGEAGQLLAWRLLSQGSGLYELVGFVDDDPAKVGMRLHDRPVLGGRDAIPELVARHRVELIIIAIYNIAAPAYREILANCERTSARVKVLPDLFDFIQRTNGLPPIRDVTVEDLLGRKPVEIDGAACRQFLAGRVVLVTGAAGSIGSELCRQVAAFGPRRLLLLDNNESGLYDLAFDLETAPKAPPLVRIVGDVTNRNKVAAVFAAHRPQVVFHAAAYKHVPLMEEHPDEAVRVNALGTLIVAELACRYGAERLVFISTDKAVSPTSVMGATKRLGEMLIASLGSETGTLCTTVRFGNVLGSRGSVVPLFERQIAMGGPVTITDPGMMRYFMSIPEAVSLVIQAAAMTQGGDLFVLDMGEQIRIEDLAVRLIRLRGLRPGLDIPIHYTGIRPGEKLHEELTDDGDRRHPTAHPSIWRVEPPRPRDRQAFYAAIRDLARLAEEQRNGQVTDALWALVGSPGHELAVGVCLSAARDRP